MIIMVGSKQVPANSIEVGDSVIRDNMIIMVTHVQRWSFTDEVVLEWEGFGSHMFDKGATVSKVVLL